MVEKSLPGGYRKAVHGPLKNLSYRPFHDRYYRSPTSGAPAKARSDLSKAFRGRVYQRVFAVAGSVLLPNDGERL